LKTYNNNNNFKIKTIINKLSKTTIFLFLILFFRENAFSQVDLSKYNKVYDFSENIVKVQLNGKYGLVTKNGTEITSIEFDEIGDIKEELALVKKDEKRGFINDKGKLVVPLKYAVVDPFMNGKARVCIREDSEFKYGFIDKTGKEIIPVKYGFPRRSGDNYVIAKKDGKVGMLDWTGTVIIPFLYEELENFSQNRAKVKLDGKYGFIDKDNNKLTEIKYTDVYDFSEDMAAVKFKDLQGTAGIWGFVNLNGKEVIKSDDYCRAESFKNGTAKVLNCAINKWIKINKKGEVIE